MSLAEQIFALMHAKGDKADMLLPPPIFEHMGAEMIHFDPDAKLLRVRFPVRPEFQNPMRMMQGGMLAAAIDNTVGPLSFAIAPASVTTQITVSYVRPVLPDMPYIEVEGVVTEQTRRQLFMSATVYSPDGKVLALSTISTVLIEA